MRLIGILFCFIATSTCAQQERAAHVFLGMPVGLNGAGGNTLSPKPGFALGLDYWFFNENRNTWSLGATYSFFTRKNEQVKETFEYLTLRAMPLVWHINKKKTWYIEAGVFGNYLFHQELQESGSVVNNTKILQRTYLGPSVGIGARLGSEGRTRILVGIRDDFGALGLGKGTPLNFNTITLFAGLEI